MLSEAQVTQQASVPSLASGRAGRVGAVALGRCGAERGVHCSADVRGWVLSSVLCNDEFKSKGAAWSDLGSSTQDEWERRLDER